MLDKIGSGIGEVRMDNLRGHAAAQPGCGLTAGSALREQNGDRNLRQHLTDAHQVEGLERGKNHLISVVQPLDQLCHLDGEGIQRGGVVGQFDITRVGLWEYRDMRVGEFSKGMKVRLNFVRAMLNAPRMLFLDEVTNGLDPANARIIKDMIAEFRQGGGTVFLTTHLMSDVEQLCDRVAFCVQGKLAEVSTPRELKLRYGTREVTAEYREEGRLARRSFPMAGIGENADFIRLLKEKEIETLHSGETSMEDIFIRVTGVKEL